MRSRSLVGTLTQIAAPSVEPVDVEDAKLRTRVDTNVDDDMIRELIVAARQECEAFTRRALITQTWQLVMDDFPGVCIEFPNPPLISVSVKYDDEDGVEQTVPSTNYVVTAPSGPHAERGFLKLKTDASWPETSGEPGCVRFEFDAGYGPAGDDVPEALRSAILMMVAEMYERRTEATVGVSQSMNTLGSERLMYPFRSLRW